LIRLLPPLLALRNALRELGYVEMSNYVFVPRCAVREGEEMLSAAKDLVGQKIDVIMVGSNELAEALKKATTTVAVVFIAVTDPEEAGLVASLARREHHRLQPPYSRADGQATSAAQGHPAEAPESRRPRNQEALGD
jgi:hypothetical protein